jgi:hypothetical protein
METKDQNFKISEKSSADKKLKYDYSSIDDFFADEIEPTELSGAFRDLHISFTRALALLANNNIKFAVPDILINQLASLNNFCECLDCI